jgi:glutamyl-tRNA synthetase
VFWQDKPCRYQEPFKLPIYNLFFMLRTRQAPSPTGFLHFGTSCTMLFTQLIAQSEKGIWYLRLEDTDRNRLQPDAVGSLLASMKTLGLNPNEGVNTESRGIQDSFYKVYQDGNYGPYIQSERLEYYHKYAQQLIDSKYCYWSYIKEDDKLELQELKKINKKAVNYFQANIQKLSGAPLTDSSAIMTPEIEAKMFATVEQGLLDEQKPDLRFRIQEDKEVTTTDHLLGKTTFNMSLEEDFTALKSDGYPTYHLAHAIDDKLMATSLVIRSQEWISSLPKHYCLTQALWGEVFNYLHIPFILGETGNKKMSKRDGNVNMQDYLDKGYLPEAIINYLAFLGWNPGTSKELYLDKEDFATPQELRMDRLIANLAADFSMDKLVKSPARFSLDKLNWFNQQYIKMLPTAEFAKKMAKGEVVVKNEDVIFTLLDQERLVTAYTDSPETLDSYKIKNWVKPAIEHLSFKGASSEATTEALSKILPFIKEALARHRDAKEVIHSNPNSTNLLLDYTNLYRGLDEDIKGYMKANEMPFGSYLYPLRMALSGQQQSPSPFEIMAVLPDNEVIERIESFL